jgi:hypothetical protein
MSYLVHSFLEPFWVKDLCNPSNNIYNQCLFRRIQFPKLICFGYIAYIINRLFKRKIGG